MPFLTDYKTIGGALLFVCVCAAPTTSARAQSAQSKMTAPATIGRTFQVALQTLPDVATDAQFRTIAEAAKIAQAGDTVLIHAGTYRETVVIEKSGTPQNPIRFEAAPGAYVTITGADQITDWRKETGASEKDNFYSMDWGRDLVPDFGGKRVDEDNLVFRTEQVMVQDYALKQVLSRAALTRGTFWIDSENKRLYAWSSSNEKLPERRVEVSVRPLLMRVTGENVHVKGLRFRYAANPAQQSAADFRGAGGVIEDCVFERTNSVGAGFRAPNQTVRRCVFQDNGQMGWGAGRAHNSVISDCITRNNNTKNFPRGFEAGGDKIVLTRGLVIENSQFTDNRGTGIWFDIGNEACIVRNCLLANNEDSGIFYEISYGLQLRDNVIVGNGWANYPGWWGGWSGATLSSSPGAVIERNLFVGNREGFDFREQSRTTPLIDSPKGTPEIAIWNHDSTIRNNTFAFNGEAQIWGWFDTKEEAHWPRAMQDSLAKTVADTARPNDDLAADYGAKGETSKPKDLSLEELNLTFASNVYAPAANGRLVRWGPEWAKKKKTYTDLKALQTELNMDKNSVVAPIQFADVSALDLRVAADSATLKMGAYPRGAVPGVKLGVMP